MREFSLAIGICLCCLCAPPALPAELLSQALRFFPATTRSLEYDNLAALRKLPNYAALRQQYAGASLDRAKAALSKLGITEESMQQVVTATGASPGDFYGLVSGTFSETQAATRPPNAGLRPLPLGDQRAQCSGNGVCVLFLEDSLAAFGGPDDLRTLRQVRQGTAPGLTSNTGLSNLLAKALPRAPVVGVAPGNELNAWIGDSAPKALLSQANLSKVLDTIRLFQYSVQFGNKAHLDLNLECTSPMAATTLKEALTALNALHSVMGSFSSGTSVSQFDNMTAASTGTLVHLTLDASVN